MASPNFVDKVSSRKIDLTQVLPETVLQEIVDNLYYQHVKPSLPLSNSYLQELYLNTLAVDRNIYEAVYETKLFNESQTISNINLGDEASWNIGNDPEDAINYDTDELINIDEKVKIGLGNIKLFIPYEVFNGESLDNFDENLMYWTNVDDNSIVVQSSEYDSKELSLLSNNQIDIDIITENFSKYGLKNVSQLSRGRYTNLTFTNEEDADNALMGIDGEIIAGQLVSAMKGDTILALLVPKAKNTGYITLRYVLDSINKYFSEKLAGDHRYFEGIGVYRSGDDIILQPVFGS